MWIYPASSFATRPDRHRRNGTPGPAPQPPGRPTSQSAAPTGENRRGLEILLRKVRQYWIEGVLEKSLFQAILIDLGMQRMQDAVDNPCAETPWTGLLERPGAETQALAPQQKLADVFEEEGGSLLILGEPVPARPLRCWN